MTRFRLFGILVLLFIIAPTFSQIPRQMNYQGFLTDNNNNPVTGNLMLRFTIYDALVAGTNLWYEEHPNVALIDGVFRVVLGNTNPLDLPFDKPYWLGIRVGNDPEMQPRVALTSVGYSLNSLKAENVKDSSVTTASIQDGAVTLPKLQPEMMTKVFEGTANNVNSYLITGLDGNLHQIYKIYFQGIIHTGETWFLLRPNEDDVVNNYRGYVVYQGDASGAQWAAVGLLMGRTWIADNSVGFEITFYAETGKLRGSIGHGICIRPTGQILGQDTFGYWINTADNVTRLKFSLTNFSGVSTGTFSGTFSVYGLNPR